MKHLIINQYVSLNQSANELIFRKTGFTEYIRIEPRLSKLLTAIISKRGDVATRDELIEQVWEGNQGVGRKALTKSIYKLRQVFQEHLGEELIETIPKQGYRLGYMRIVPHQPQKGKRKWLSISIAALILWLLIVNVVHPDLFQVVFHRLGH